MKLMSSFAISIVLSTTVYAGDWHGHLEVNDQKSASIRHLYHDFCVIEIVNHSGDDIVVAGTFDDGVRLMPFIVYSYEASVPISLYYHGYCHDGMELYIYNVDTNEPIYSQYTPVDEVIHMLPYLYETKKR